MRVLADEVSFCFVPFVSYVPFCVKKTTPAIVVGYDSGGLSSTPSDEVGVPSLVFTDARGGRRPDLSKNLCKQFEAMHRHQAADARQHVFNRERLREKTIRAGVQTSVAYF